MKPDDIDMLERIADLKTKGILTEEEFLAEKARLLGNTHSKNPVEQVPRRDSVGKSEESKKDEPDVKADIQFNNISPEKEGKLSDIKSDLQFSIISLCSFILLLLGIIILISL